MDHSKMDHSGHMGHGDMPGMPMPEDSCSMNMLFNWETNNLCIVFPSWHIRSTSSLLLSLFAISLIVIGFEALRAQVAAFSLRSKQRVSLLPNPIAETSALMGTGQVQGKASKRDQVVKAALYAVQTFYAFMIMLIFMTYNGYVMGAVTVGAFVGYLIFGGQTELVRETACH